MDQQDRAIRRFRRHLAVLLVLRYALPLATVWGFAWGVAVLALRAATDVERIPLLWGLVGLAGCLALAAWRARRGLPSPTVIRALLDEQSGCGGLLMAGAEKDLGDWRGRMPALTPPGLRWEGRRAGALLATAAGFVLLCFLAPRGLADLMSSSPLDVDKEIARLMLQITLLQSEKILNPERTETLKEKLAELSKRASGKDPARTLEALDHLRELTKEAARQAAEQKTRRSERLGEAEALAEMLRQHSDLFNSQMKAETLAELAGLLEKSGLNVTNLSEGFDPEQLRKLTATLQLDKAELLQQMEKLHKAGLIDAETLARCRCAGNCDNEGLMAFLQGRNPGEGGVSRGPGAAEMTWRKPDAEAGYKFKEEILPPSALDAVRSRAVQETLSQRVKHKKSTQQSQTGALQDAAAGSGSANTDPILPRHRAAVERYFERKSEIRNPKSERNQKE